MGYLTTFTICNDGIDKILKDSDEFCEKLYKRAISGKTNRFGHGGFGGLVKVQKTRHADDYTTYVHMENTVCEMNAYSRETEEFMKNPPELFKDILNYMGQQVKDLEKKFDKYKAEAKSQE